MLIGSRRLNLFQEVINWNYDANVNCKKCDLQYLITSDSYDGGKMEVMKQTVVDFCQREDLLLKQKAFHAFISLTSYYMSA
jgi:hypothetical protein